MRQTLANREQGEAQTENEERKTSGDQQSTRSHRQETGSRFAEYKDLEYADDEDNR